MPDAPVVTQHTFAESRLILGAAISPPLPPPGIDRADREEWERDMVDWARRAPVRIEFRCDGRQLACVSVIGLHTISFGDAKVVLRAGQVFETIAPRDWVVTLDTVEGGE